MILPPNSALQAPICATLLVAGRIKPSYLNSPFLAGKKPVSAHDGTVQLGDLGCEGVGVVEHVGEDIEWTSWSHDSSHGLANRPFL